MNQRIARSAAALLGLLFALTLLPGRAEAYATIDACNPSWPAASLPSRYYVNQNGYSAIPLLDVRTIFTNSFAAWGEPCCSSFSAREMGLTTDVGENNAVANNVMSFREASWPASLGDGTSVLAVTLPQWNGRCSLVSADMVFNGFNHDFASNGRFGGNDLQSITTHEAGHWLGLDHSSVASATMYYAYSGGEGSRTLHQDDIDGVCFLYEQACGCSTTADCTGAGEECVGGQCIVPPCTADSDCDAGLICDAGTCVVPPCGSDADCVGNQVCVAGSCITQTDCPICAACNTADDCGGSPYVCAQDPNGGTGGFCTLLCNAAGDCPGDSDCFTVPGQGFNVCLNPDAATGSVCPTGYVCGGGTTGLCDGVTCPAGQTCDPATGACSAPGSGDACANICDGCTTDADCDGGLGSCVDFGNGGICSTACSATDPCPGLNTDCFTVQDTTGASQNLCFNADAATDLCPATWRCETAPPAAPCDGVTCPAGQLCDAATGNCIPDSFDGSRGGSCGICDSCRTDADCGGGICKNFVGIGQFCTQTCDAGCPGNATCFALGAQQLCLNPDAGSAGVCNAGFVCNEPTPDPDAGSIDTGTGSDTGSTGTDTGSTGTDTGTTDNNERPSVRARAVSSGCSATGGAASLAALLALAGLLLLRRRRATASR